MTNTNPCEFWFLTGSRHLYGQAPLARPPARLHTQFHRDLPRSTIDVDFTHHSLFGELP